MTRQEKKFKNSTKVMGKQLTPSASEGTYLLDLLIKGFKVATINIFIELKEINFEELKKSITTMNQQIKILIKL